MGNIAYTYICKNCAKNEKTCQIKKKKAAKQMAHNYIHIHTNTVPKIGTGEKRLKCTRIACTKK
jgi:hypothetical protein